MFIGTGLTLFGNAVGESGGGSPPASVPINAPVLALAVSPTTYPPEFDVSLDETVLVGDTLVLEWASDVRFNSIVGTASNAIDSSEATAQAATFTGLSSISSGTNYFRVHVERSSNDPSSDSNIVIHGEAEDATPAAFSFTDVTNVTASSTQTSAEVTPTGFNVPVEITVSGGSYAIDTGSGYGSFTTSAGTFYPGDKVKARHTASASFETATNTTVTIGGISDTFTSTTELGPNPTWSTINKAAGITLSGTNNLTATGTDSGSLVYKTVLCDRPIDPSGGSCEFTVDLYKNQYGKGTTIGLAKPGASLSAVPGYTGNANGVCCMSDSWGYELFKEGAMLGYQYGSGIFTSGQRWKIDWGSGVWNIYKWTGSAWATVNGGGPYALPSGDLYPFATFISNDKVTADFSGMM